MLGIVLAGGNGTRFAKNGCCKPLLKLNGKHLIEYSLDNLLAMGAERAVIVVGKYRDSICAVLGDRYCGMQLQYAVQMEPAGCIHALYCALPFWNGETAVLQLSDEVYLGFHTAAAELPPAADFICGYTKAANRETVKENYAIRCAGRSRTLIRCEEKPKTVPNNKKGVGLCIFNAACIRHLQERYDIARDHYVTLCDFMNHLLADGKTGFAVEIAREEININTQEKLRYAEKALREFAENE